MSRKGLIIAGLLTFLAASILMFPARVAVHWFAPAEVRLNGISGSIWSGQASEGYVGQIYVSDLRWSFQPHRMLTGKLGATASVMTAAGRINTDAAVSVGGTVTLTDVDAQLSLAAIHTAFASNRIDGSVQINMHSVTLKDGFPTEADGQIEVNGFVAGALGPAPVGNFRAAVSNGDTGIEALVEDAGAVVNLTGNALLNADRSYQFTGLVGATAQTPPAINQNLRFLGSPDANGMHSFRFEGSL